MSIFIGLDMSLSATGFCLRDGVSLTMDTIRTKPDSFTNDLDRLKHIAAETMRRIPKDVTMICMEDFFTPGNAQQIGAAIKLAMLGTVIRMALYEAKLPLFVIAAGSIKKFATGKGSGQKSIVVREVYKRWGVDAKDDNQADACVLAYIAEAIVALPADAPDFQKDVIEVILQNRPRYNITGVVCASSLPEPLE